MTPLNVVRRLLLPVFALAAAWSNVTPASAADCEEIGAYQRAVGPNPRSGLDPSVGIVIHIMERPSPEHECEVRKVWTPEQVKIIFAGGPEDQQSVNSIWGSTKVRFTVEVVLKRADPPEGMVDSRQRIKVPPKTPGSDEYEKAFTSLVDENHRDHKINVYLWKLLSVERLGYGRSIRSGNGKATVFLDTRCNKEPLKACALYAAHELGHALGLYHAGQDCRRTVGPPFLGLCLQQAKPCAEVKRSDRLMLPVADPRGTNRKLCPLEVEKAEAMAMNEFK